MSEQMLDIEKIRIDGDTQPRVAIDENTVKQYAADMERGAEFPPVQVMFDGAAYWLVDGFHRYHAHKKLSKAQIAVEVATGVQTEAQWQSLTANKTHGLRRTNDDKVKAVLKAIKLKPDLTDHVIARHVGVSQPMVSKYRASIEEARKRQEKVAAAKKAVDKGFQQAPGSGGEVSRPAKRIGKDGKRYSARKPQSKRSATSSKPAISPTAMTPIRGLSPVDERKHIGMSKDPLMGARALVDLFDRSYLEILIAEVRAILDGTAGTPPSLQNIAHLIQ
ncbi:MAG: ParB N-terminal domain-containing protein [Phycisphaerales bacterium]|nr:ParB N-terminal domain-containing protein [Phycisphaerales bacterium]